VIEKGGISDNLHFILSSSVTGYERICRDFIKFNCQSNVMGPVLSIAGMVISGISSIAAPPPQLPSSEPGVKPMDFSEKDDVDITGFRDADSYDITGFNENEEDMDELDESTVRRKHKEDSITGF